MTARVALSVECEECTQLAYHISSSPARHIYRCPRGHVTDVDRPVSGQPRRGALSRTSDPQTAHDAARRVNVTGLEQSVLAALHRTGNGATTHEIAAEMKVEWTSVSPRMAPLERKGLVERTLFRRDGRIVWVAT